MGVEPVLVTSAVLFRALFLGAGLILVEQTSIALC